MSSASAKTAMNLRRFGLRIMSSPFDWVNSATFGTRIDLLCKDFDGFCSKEGIEKGRSLMVE